MPRQTTMVTARCETTRPSTRAYHASKLSSARSMYMYQFFLGFFSALVLGRRRSHWLQSMGVSDRAQVVDMIIMIVTIHPN